jgi:hypothetical protein
MPDETSNQPESSWLLEPPGADEVHIAIELGSDVELSAEARDALDRLMSSLGESEEAEVGAFACVIGPCPDYRICKTYGKCRPRETGTCLAWFHCRIGTSETLS